LSRGKTSVGELEAKKYFAGFGRLNHDTASIYSGLPLNVHPLNVHLEGGIDWHLFLFG